MPDQPTPIAVLPFSDQRCRDVHLAGGKGASLAEMTGHGLPVPAGFVVTAEAFADAVDADALRERMRARQLDHARKLVAAAEPPRAEIAAQLARLPAGPVAVRSSACAEDSVSASYAGQQESYLHVEGLDDVLAKVVACWLSFFSDQAVFYREQKGSLEDVAMAVAVQQMVNAHKAGVLFTVDPVNGRRDRVVVEAAPGLGENVVSGERTPDYYALDRRGVLKKSRTPADPVMTEEELADLTELGLRVAALYGCPQDIEWAYDDRAVFLLQSRPITTLG